ncbi:enterobactin exporter EntS [compost metagenome]
MGDALGALGVGALARLLAPLGGVLVLGGGTALLAALLGLLCTRLRQLGREDGLPDEALSQGA